MKKALTAVSLLICTALIFALLCSCSKKEDVKPANGGVPDKVVSRTQQTDPEPGSTQSTEPSVSVSGDDVPEQTTSADDSAQPANSGGAGTAVHENEPVTEPAEDENVTASEEEGRAAEYLKLLNSSRVHAVLLEASSHDNENATSIEREYFVDGDNAVFINGDTKIIMASDEVTVIDMAEMTYYSYPRDGEDTGANFGYSISDYTLVSQDEDEDGSLTEVYEVSSRGDTIKSTWTYFPDGKVTVADVSSEFGYYNWYSFSLIESDVSGMDMSIPEGVIETEPEDYF